MKRIAKDIAIAILLFAGVIAFDSYLAGLVVDWLQAHGMDAHVPDSGPLREKHDAAVGSLIAVVMLFLVLFTITPVVFVLSHFRLWIWNSNRPWNKKDEPKTPMPSWVHDRLAYEQRRDRR